MIVFVIWLQTRSGCLKDEKICLFDHRLTLGATKRSWMGIYISHHSSWIVIVSMWGLYGVGWMVGECVCVWVGVGGCGGGCVCVGVCTGIQSEVEIEYNTVKVRTF